MDIGKPPARNHQTAIAPSPGESTGDYRARIAERQAEALEQRQRDLAEQASDINTPAARIRIWERLHQIALPRDPSHGVLAVVAANTGLSVEEVRVEQRQRTLSASKPEA
jgi:hypothetical protein